MDLSPEMVVLLRAHIAKLREDSFRKSKPTPEMLFPNSAGKHIDWQRCREGRICKKVKIGPFRPYDLRHTFASLLPANGAPITYGGAQLGHREPTTTLRYYARWLPKDGRRYVDVQNRQEAAEAAAATE